MASAASNTARLCLLASRRTPGVQRLARPRSIPRQCLARRALSTTPAQRAEGSGGLSAKERRRAARVPVKLEGMEKSFMESATPEGLRQLDQMAKKSGFNSVQDFLESKLQSPDWKKEDKELRTDLRSTMIGDKPIVNSYWYDETDPETTFEEHDEFDEDDITSMAHGKLDEIREQRQYARLTVWEMPLLAKLAKPFEPPTDDQVLRWRYTSYMGETHPAEKKVVVQFAPDDLKLTPVQTMKLKKLVGPRYNPETEMVKMSCESFEHQAQNKSHLTQLVNDLVTAAKDPTDTFEDIPLDLRHHRYKNQNKPKFPVEWRMTEERRRELENHRQRLAIEDRDRLAEGKLVEGQKLIDEYVMLKLAEEQGKQERQAELVSASQGARASGRGRAKRI